MNILRRGVPALEAGNALDAGNRRDAAEAAVSRRIEVTVERETVTMLVRAQPGGTGAMDQENGTEAAGENKTPTSEPAKLPLPRDAANNEAQKHFAGDGEICKG